MDNPNFDFEYYSEVNEIDEVDEQAREQALNRLESLAEGYRDMIGASVAVEEISNEETPHRFKVRIVVYTKPNYIAATEKGSNISTALLGALEAVERQVREMRDKKGKPWKMN